MKCLRIYASTDGESHLAQIEISQSLAQVFPNEPPLQVSKLYNAAGVKFVTVPPSVGEVGWHHAPERMFGIILRGTMEFEISDGSAQRVGPGGVVVAEDTFGKGHISRHPEGVALVFVPFSDDV